MSGVLLFARNAAAAAALCAKIEGREVEKVYVARVLGRFPSSEGPVVADVPLAWDPSTNHVTAEPGQAGSAAAAVAGADVQAEAAAGADTLAAAASVDRHSPGAAGAAPVQEQQQQQQDQTAEGEGPQAGAASDRTQRKLLKKAYKQQRKQAKAERVAAVAAATAAAAASKSSKRAAKPALTEFRLLEVAADGLTSLVECRHAAEPAVLASRIRWGCLLHDRSHDSCGKGTTVCGSWASLSRVQRCPFLASVQASHRADSPDTGAPAVPGAPHRQ